MKGDQRFWLSRRRYAMGFTRGKQLRTVAFPYGRHLFFGIEQNPRTHSRWAALAREGKRVIQFSYRGQYGVNVCESTVFRYPAWKTLRLPQ